MSVWLIPSIRVVGPEDVWFITSNRVVGYQDSCGSFSETVWLVPSNRFRLWLRLTTKQRQIPRSTSITFYDLHNVACLAHAEARCTLGPPMGDVCDVENTADEPTTPHGG